MRILGRYCTMPKIRTGQCHRALTYHAEEGLITGLNWYRPVACKSLGRGSPKQKNATDSKN